MIKYRIWTGDDFLYPSLFIIDNLNNAFFTYKGEDTFTWDLKNAQRFTGFQSKDKKDIYEGDIIKFKYTVGDQAWEHMTDKELVENDKLHGKTFIGTVVPCIIEVNNLEIIVGDIQSTHIRFPLSYAANSKIIGNIFSNKKKLAFPKHLL